MFEPEVLKDYEARGLIRSQAHPDYPLRIYNYTELTAYDRLWDDVTLNCRGLIQDGNGTTIARPFRKFFNFGEMFPDRIPYTEAHYIQEKLDGSLIIVSDSCLVASRGSFTSEQAEHARAILVDAYPGYEPPAGWTALFEIIYPANRIVVNYHDTDDLVLIGLINNETGEDWPVDTLAESGWPGPIVGLVMAPIRDLERTCADPENGANREGFVVVWPLEGQPSLRLKLKFSQYVMLHKIVTGLSTLVVWEALAADKFDELIEIVPDEWFDAVRNYADYLVAEFNFIADTASADYLKIPQGVSRKEQADVVKQLPNPHLLFAMLDSKPLASMIFKMIRPVHEPLLIPLTDAE